MTEGDSVGSYGTQLVSTQIDRISMWLTLRPNADEVGSLFCFKGDPFRFGVAVPTRWS